MADTGPQLRRGRWAAMDQLADSRRTAAGRQQPTQSGHNVARQPRELRASVVFTVLGFDSPPDGGKELIFSSLYC